MGLGQLFQERPAAVLRTSFPLRVFRSAHRWVSWSTPHYRRSVARPWTWVAFGGTPNHKPKMTILAMKKMMYIAIRG